ncbi:MAG: 50S ribosomal protein L2 [Patescibacteria group bacterium]
MGIKFYKPTTPGRRATSVDDFSDITKKKPEKNLTAPLKKRAGRNNQGRVTVHHRGGGAKRKYRIVDFKQNIYDIPAEVKAIEYDPNRTCRIALIEYEGGQKSYILAAQKLKVGDKVMSSQKRIESKPANRMPLKDVPIGLSVYNIELSPGNGGEIVRSAGTGALVQGSEGEFVQLKMPSGEIRIFNKMCVASIGQVSNPEWRNIRWGLAGRMRNRGIRPTVRGKAKNPCDHPHGGGEGNQPIGLKNPKTPWGKPALGVNTRNKKKKSNIFIIKRRKK